MSQVKVNFPVSATTNKPSGSIPASQSKVAIPNQNVNAPVATKNGGSALVSPNGYIADATLAPKNPANGVKNAGCGDVKPSATPTPAQPQASIVDTTKALGSYPADVSPLSNKK
jgi:hypothetical protein